MLWPDFTAKVLTYLDVDATRRGISTMRDSFTRAAVVDLKHFIDAFKDGVEGAPYGNTDLSPFRGHEEKAAEAVAMYVKHKIARTIDKDLAMAQSYWADYQRIRRELAREGLRMTSPLLELWPDEPLELAPSVPLLAF